MSPVKKAYHILRHLGPRFVWLRAGIQLNKRLGTTRRKFQPIPWGQISLASITRAGTPTTPDGYAEFKRRQAPPFLFPLGTPPEIPKSLSAAAGQRQPQLAERLRLIADDRCVYFFRIPSPEPIDWYVDPLHHKRGVADTTWCDAPDFSAEQGDIRTLWEPARAAWALDLARAHARGAEIDAAGLFWRWVDSWMKACPPFRGAQWKCGQEAAIRLIAIATGFWALASDPAATPQRWQQFARLAWATGYRIYHHIHYAVSQKNNHSLSEACGLLLVSQLFPEFRASPKWHNKGRNVLAREICRQTYADGSYLQQSMNYQRVMLDVCLLALRLAELAGQPFERDLYDRLAHCGEFLFQMMDPDTGRLPNYGNNDGACVLPLSECDFSDYRPVVQATHYLAHRRRRLPPGPWDEDLLWLFGAEALAAAQETPRRPASSAFEVGGYYTLRGRESWAMIRCHTYRDRPGHADALHLDLWWRGQNVLCDCGTYQYCVPDDPDLERYFKSTAAHNTVELDQRDPLELVSRFLWLPWPRARKRHFEATAGTPLVFEGEHYDYDRAPWHVLHRRTVLAFDDDVWVVVDDLIGEGEREAVLRWHLLDAPYTTDRDRREVRLAAPAGDLFIRVTIHPPAPHAFDVVRGRDESGHVHGFAAPYYGQLLSIPTLEVATRVQPPRRLITTVSPHEATAIRHAGEDSGCERWALATLQTRYTLELACPTRRVEKTFLECRAS